MGGRRGGRRIRGSSRLVPRRGAPAHRLPRPGVLPPLRRAHRRRARLHDRRRASDGVLPGGLPRSARWCALGPAPHAAAGLRAVDGRRGEPRVRHGHDRARRRRRSTGRRPVGGRHRGVDRGPPTEPRLQHCPGADGDGIPRAARRRPRRSAVAPAAGAGLSRPPERRRGAARVRQPCAPGGARAPPRPGSCSVLAVATSHRQASEDVGDRHDHLPRGAGAVGGAQHGRDGPPDVGDEHRRQPVHRQQPHRLGGLHASRLVLRRLPRHHRPDDRGAARPRAVRPRPSLGCAPPGRRGAPRVLAHVLDVPVEPRRPAGGAELRARPVVDDVSPPHRECARHGRRRLLVRHRRPRRARPCALAPPAGCPPLGARHDRVRPDGRRVAVLRRHPFRAPGRGARGLSGGVSARSRVR